MSAKEAKAMSDAKREPYIAGLVSHYLQVTMQDVQACANIGRNSAMCQVSSQHYNDTVKRLTKELRKLGYKVTTDKKNHKVHVSWDENELPESN